MKWKEDNNRKNDDKNGPEDVAFLIIFCLELFIGNVFFTYRKALRVANITKYEDLAAFRWEPSEFGSLKYILTVIDYYSFQSTFKISSAFLVRRPNIPNPAMLIRRKRRSVEIMAFWDLHVKL